MAAKGQEDALAEKERLRLHYERTAAGSTEPTSPLHLQPPSSPNGGGSSNGGQSPSRRSNSVPITEEELDDLQAHEDHPHPHHQPNSNPNPNHHRAPTPPPYSGPSTTSIQESASPRSPQPKGPQKYPGLPPLDYRLYNPPLFDRSADLITIKTSAPYLSASAAALAALIRAQCSIPPKPQLHIVGRRASGSRVDFAIKLNLMSLILPEEQKQQRMDYMRCVAPGEPALRGGSKPSTEPSVGGDGGGGLDEWARRYVDDTTGGSKSFALERVVVNMDVDWLEGQVRSLVASTGYKGVVAVSFPVTHARVVVQSPDRVNKFFTSVTTMFTGKRRYEVVKAVWPFATARNGEAGRRCAVMSEEAWWREWKESVRYAIVTKRQGWVTIEDKLEVIMEGVGRDTPVVDWGPEY